MAVKKRKTYDEHEMILHKARVLRSNGWTIEEIAAELKVSFSTVHTILQEIDWREGSFELV